MSKNLVIVESPAKAKTIEKFLGKDFLVKSSMGHVRDLPEKNLGVEIEANFTPVYEIPPGKKKLVNELKDATKKAEMVWLATDEDREGEAISWHLQQVLNLPEDKTKRIAFHEITKSAILHAIENPRQLDIHLVNAQQARRILDRLVGFELSPVLWRKVKPSLSAGRVQSVAVRLVVEKEKEIRGFVTESAYKLVAEFIVDEQATKETLRAVLNTKFKTQDEALAFLKNCQNASFAVDDVETHPLKRSPAPPFTTSTLQQEASRKLSFPVAKTMVVAQQLYESGHITYMRTDSVNLSETALQDAETEIQSAYGKEYSHKRKYTVKTKGAQEAHEAIRPTYISKHTIDVQDSTQKRLYELIWKRTIASQMSEAKFEKTTVQIGVSTEKHKFVAEAEALLFDGFLKVYIESQDDEEEQEIKALKLPALTVGKELTYKEITATQRYTLPPYRYTEASLVKKLEELGIGRPSTYAPTISTIIKRGYVSKGDILGHPRNSNILTLKKNKITETNKNEIVNKEKAKLSPTDIGTVVTDFLTLHFKDVLNYDFTARVEKEFDEIADGKKEWNKMIAAFYGDFHQVIETTLKHSERAKGERKLGIDPETGKEVFAKLARYGPVVQIGDANTTTKPSYSKLLPGQSIDSITLEEALDLFKLPREVGVYEGEEIKVNIGRFGPYVLFKKKFYSLSKEVDLMTVTKEECLEVIAQKEKNDESKKIRILGQYEEGDVQVAVGRYGPYVSFNKAFFALPKDADVTQITLEEAVNIIVNTRNKNNIKVFEEDKDVKVLKGRYGAYIAYGKKNFKIPKDLIPAELTYKQCLEIIGKTPKKKK